MHQSRDMTDEQWKSLDPLIPEPIKRRDGRGRPWKSRRSVMNGILWVLRTGTPWADLPDRYPSFQTCHRRFQQWVCAGVMTRIMTAFANELASCRAIDVREAFIDASFAPAKKGALRSERQTRKGNKDRMLFWKPSARRRRSRGCGLEPRTSLTLAVSFRPITFTLPHARRARSRRRYRR